MGRFDFEPHDTATRIADAGMRAMENQAERERVTLGETLISLAVEDAPVGEGGAALHVRSAEHDDPTHMLAVLCARARDIAEQQGIPLEMLVAGRRV